MTSSIEEKIKTWCEKRNIDLCIMFGSQVKERTHANSDTDIALWSFSQPDLIRQWLKLNGELEDLFGYPIDLTVMHRDTDPVLRLEIFQHGKPLYEARPGLFIQEHITAIKLYDDTEPLRRMRDQVLAQRILNLKYVGRKKDVPTNH